MERALRFPAKVQTGDAPPEHEVGLFSTESALNLQKPCRGHSCFSTEPLPRRWLPGCLVGKKLQRRQPAQ
jgi:hypothetical protein